jgi:hypothetical protein
VEFEVQFLEHLGRGGVDVAGRVRTAGREPLVLTGTAWTAQ